MLLVFACSWKNSLRQEASRGSFRSEGGRWSKTSQFLCDRCWCSLDLLCYRCLPPHILQVPHHWKNQLVPVVAKTLDLGQVNHHGFWGVQHVGLWWFVVSPAQYVRYFQTFVGIVAHRACTPRPLSLEWLLSLFSLAIKSGETRLLIPIDVVKSAKK